jgi:hypothetical protein
VSKIPLLMEEIVQAIGERVNASPFNFHLSPFTKNGRSGYTVACNWRG